MKIIVKSVYTGLTKEDVKAWAKELASKNPEFEIGREDFLNGDTVHLSMNMNQHVDVTTSFETVED